jgi:RND family efflux transporter MFP subunit
LVRADAFPGKIFKGHVQSITPMGDAVARSYRVRVELEDETPFLIGMTAETNIVIRKDDNALLVPTSAVQKDRVWRVVDNRLVEQKVTVGARGTDKTEIRDGLADGDQVVLKPDTTFKDGQRVRAHPAASS